MLDDLTPNDRERSIQLEDLAGVMKEIQGRTSFEDQDRVVARLVKLRKPTRRLTGSGGRGLRD